MTRIKLSGFAGISLMASLLAQSGTAAVALDRLSACSELHQFRAALDAPEVCRAPVGRIANVLNSRIQSWPGIRICFRNVMPSTTEAGFECTSVKTALQPEGLLCIREVLAVDIHDYKSRYREIYDPLVKGYLQRASTCDVGNGDASPMAPTVLPWIVAIVAEHDFGFILPVGNRLVGSSAFVHGFGHLDPDVYADNDRFVEYLYTWRKSP